MKPIIFHQNHASVNSYLLAYKEECVVIDPGFNGEEILAYIELHQLKLSKVLLTHGHFDHIRDIRLLAKKYVFTVFIHDSDKPMLTDDKLNYSTMFGSSFRIKDDIAIIQLKHLDTIEFGKDKLTLYHTPGHTMGSSCFLYQNMLFSGDTLFEGDLGRTDLISGSQKLLEKSIVDLFGWMSNETLVYPGHENQTTIGQERKNNLYVIRILKNAK